MCSACRRRHSPTRSMHASRCSSTPFRGNPLRRAFTRLNSTATTASSMDIELPRGSTSIHLYVVLGVSAGQDESELANRADGRHLADRDRGASHRMPPSPMIEVQRILDTSTNSPTYKANLMTTTRPGPRSARIDILACASTMPRASSTPWDPPIAA